MTASPSRAALLLLSLLPMGLQAQSIYRCGNAYGQTPCPGGSVVAADDSRSAQQKAQTDAATAQATRQGDRMEHERLAHARAAVAIHAPARVRPAPATEKATRMKKRKAAAIQPPAPPYFTAASGRNDKKKPQTPGDN